jgi:hypothetical protein
MVAGVITGAIAGNGYALSNNTKPGDKSKIIIHNFNSKIGS